MALEQGPQVGGGAQPGQSGHDRQGRVGGFEPQNAPRYSIAGELVRERGQEGHPTTMERAALTSRWGE